MKLYGYWRSSASYRVRIALNLKEIEVEHVPVNLKLGEHKDGAYAGINPQRLVPTLELDDDHRITQSEAIIAYLDEVYRRVPLYPSDPLTRAQVRAAVSVIGADTAPIQNLRILSYLRDTFGHSDTETHEWARHWIATGLANLEDIAQSKEAAFTLTEEPSVVECFLVPQMYNARRFNVDMAALPRLCEIESRCQAIPAFEAARPENQSDAPD
ncbi:MAG: maleylacetoacetate isomerase [Henriciella sp.]